MLINKELGAQNAYTSLQSEVKSFMMGEINSRENILLPSSLIKNQIYKLPDDAAPCVADEFCARTEGRGGYWPVERLRLSSAILPLRTASKL